MTDPAIEVLTGREAPAWAERVWPCYRTVFADHDDLATWRFDVFERHAAREDYRLVVALDDETVVGFAWGYVGRRGQYWADAAAEALGRELAERWVGDHFEVVELAVDPAHRRRGLGRLLQDRLLDGVELPCLLSTADDRSDPAVLLYHRSGWDRLGALRPGVQIMGRPARGRSDEESG